MKRNNKPEMFLARLFAEKKNNLWFPGYRMVNGMVNGRIRPKRLKLFQPIIDRNTLI